MAEIRDWITARDENQLKQVFREMHYADIAELMESIPEEDAVFVFDIIDPEYSAEILLELDEELRETILQRLSPKEIAEELEELSSDDAADIISELPVNLKSEVLQEIEDKEHAQDIVELLRYDESSAGGLMAKELIKVNENWTVFSCVREMRRQAQNVTKVHSIYVVDDDNRLLGRLSLKDLLTTSLRTPIKDIYIRDILSVKVDTPDVEVARLMQKYDIEAIPVLDELGRLMGRITIDDIVDVIKDEADKDYQLAAGISQDVEADDSILELTKARFPWLFLAMMGGFVAVKVSGSFEAAMEKYQVLFFFTPLIAAMAGNVGVQSAAIIVQGLANNSLSGSIFRRLIKEVSLSLLNGLLLASILMAGSYLLLGVQPIIGVTVSIALVSVIIIASLIGTFVPITLHKNGIDPALATGPFITTSNDIFGILIYFSIAKVILGF
ncbi:MAG: magnesium transporter [Saprospiraceae bacterium]|nr:magnesium transporter [Saprospiraceae bacterium]